MPALNVRGRAASTHAFILWTFRELVEIRLSLLEVRVAALLSLLAEVVEKRRVACQLLDAREPVGIGVEGGLQHAQRKGAHLEDAVGPRDGGLLELVEGHD